VVVIRVVLWSLEVQLLCQLLWWPREEDGQSEPSPSRNPVPPTPSLHPPQLSDGSGLLLTSVNEPSQGMMPKFGVQPTQGRETSQIWRRAGADFKRPGL
jgi:hypothetical protein